MVQAPFHRAGHLGALAELDQDVDLARREAQLALGVGSWRQLAPGRRKRSAPPGGPRRGARPSAHGPRARPARPARARRRRTGCARAPPGWTPAATSAAGTRPRACRGPLRGHRSAPGRGARRRTRSGAGQPRRSPLAGAPAGAATSASRCPPPASRRRPRTRPGSRARGPPAPPPRGSTRGARTSGPGAWRSPSSGSDGPTRSRSRSRTGCGQPRRSYASIRGRATWFLSRSSAASVASYLRCTRRRSIRPRPSRQRARWAAAGCI